MPALRVPARARRCMRLLLSFAKALSCALSFAPCAHAAPGATCPSSCAFRVAFPPPSWTPPHIVSPPLKASKSLRTPAARHRCQPSIPHSHMQPRNACSTAVLLTTTSRICLMAHSFFSLEGYACCPSPLMRHSRSATLLSGPAPRWCWVCTPIRWLHALPFDTDTYTHTLSLSLSLFLSLALSRSLS
jgi:hypothetical protein